MLFKIYIKSISNQTFNKITCNFLQINCFILKYIHFKMQTSSKIIEKRILL